MADCVRNIIIRHLPVIICLYSKRRILAAELLNGKEIRPCKRLRSRIVAGELWILFSQPSHGRHTFPVRVFQFHGCSHTVFTVLIDRLSQRGTEIDQFFLRRIPHFQIGITGKRFSIIIDTTITGKQEKDTRQKKQRPHKHHPNPFQMNGRVPDCGCSQQIRGRLHYGTLPDTLPSVPTITG